ncbi:hypothetical protein BCR33DRAFT_720784 [Rhizoclosmatium globosum]|uniref:Uncharacterized protein n=1 Tax=Rhizoclosmatium globosum TaxID=329046 RepID=A0A1Y2BUV3_9FUNG|nr:hypothetical protein HDU99_002120 [Rhizoclosmatium hyalinum]ORY38417.1 hypothetical protein BCR33DRAFT_720784 [Rhizoclosmatium globosum]|eukprot:ORY38417.1 hypothetical protein BCR33DRAFT_720784 [Rhizoclosmatium globosum]
MASPPSPTSSTDEQENSLDNVKVFLKDYSNSVRNSFLQKVLMDLSVQYLVAYLLSFVFVTILPGSSWWTSKLLLIGGLIFSRVVYENRGDDTKVREYLIAYTIYESFALSYASSLRGITAPLQFVMTLAIHWFFGMSLFTFHNKAKFAGYVPHLFGAGVVCALMVLLEDGGWMSGFVAVYLFANTMITFTERLETCTPEDGLVVVVDWNMYVIPLANLYFLLK